MSKSNWFDAEDPMWFDRFKRLLFFYEAFLTLGFIITLFFIVDYGVLITVVYLVTAIITLIAIHVMGMAFLNLLFNTQQIKRYINKTEIKAEIADRYQNQQPMKSVYSQTTANSSSNKIKVQTFPEVAPNVSKSNLFNKEDLYQIIMNYENLYFNSEVVKIFEIIEPKSEITNNTENHLTMIHSINEPYASYEIMMDVLKNDDNIRLISLKIIFNHHDTNKEYYLKIDGNEENQHIFNNMSSAYLFNQLKSVDINSIYWVLNQLEWLKSNL